jgi:AraC-like DNA-binding protein
MLENTSAAAHDTLSLSLLKMRVRAFVNVTLDAGGDWAVDFPALDGFSLNVVQRGEGWLSVSGQRAKVRLRVGDCFLLTGGRTFRLARSVAHGRRNPERFEDLVNHARGGVLTCNGGGDFTVAGTLFRFEGHLPHVVFGRLPPVIHIAGERDQAAVLRWSLERFGAELRGQGIGRSLMLNHLAPIMLLQTLRTYVLTATDDDNWLVALSDPRLSKVLDAMHRDCGRNWSLPTLARSAGMSRSNLALAFKKRIGLSPMDYLKQWRMQVASELLASTDQTIGAVAGAVGYASESAFSVAFARVVGCRPGTYRARVAER